MRGNLFCNPLQYYRKIENDGIQGDAFEGIASYEPFGGLLINNISQGNSFTLNEQRFESSLERKEIYVCCLSTELSLTIANRFGAIACIEITDVPKFCDLASQALPRGMIVPAVQSNPRIGHRVRYYTPNNPPGILWALPELIAISKRIDFAWQQEFRLVFGAKGSFEFETADNRISNSPKPLIADANSYPARCLTVGNISGICKIHSFNPNHNFELPTA